MNRRIGESDEAFNARRTAYKRKWRTIRRTKNAKGKVTSRVQIPSVVETLPDAIPFVPTRRSILRDAEGKARLTWTREAPEEAARGIWVQEALDVLTKRMKPAEPVATPVVAAANTDMVGYVVGDHHLGMLSWKPETGAHYDLEIGERMLSKAFSVLVRRAPATETALIAVVGDFLHYDTIFPLTTKGHHMLDADSRYRKMIRVALRSLVNSIEAVRRKHLAVHVIIEPGNHDEYSTGFLVEALKLRYENTTVFIDDKPGKFHYHQWGNVLIGTHHGDTVKDPGKLPGIMATDVPALWGATQHRMWWTGHKHSQSFRSYPGCTVECFNILPPTDAWAAASGYRPQREMHALILNRDHGYTGRILVNAASLGE